jgi:hypothetical protein
MAKKLFCYNKVSIYQKTYTVNEIYGSHSCKSNYLDVGWKKQFLNGISGSSIQ